MNTTPFRRLLLAGAICALAVSAHAATVRFIATINQAQETPPTGSPATGTAIMDYDFATNTFDLTVSITGMTNTVTGSHIHEGAVGTPGGVVTSLGAESAYTRTSGGNLSATFVNVKHGGTPLTLLQGGAYYNIHSAQFPNGEIRGQLIGQPVRLYANMTIAQEAAANQALNFSGLNDFGGALMTYDPATNRISLRLSIFNFNNTFNNSHFHEAAAGVSGGVVVPLGNNPNANGYNNTGGYISGAFDMEYKNTAATPVADPIKLLTGGSYLNFHSSTFGGGELRGQVLASTETPSTRMINTALRGFVGTGEQQLIGGIVIGGTEPVRVLITAKGPSLTALGVAGALANPRLALFDSAGRQIAQNDDIGATPAAELAALQGAPKNSVESALLVVLSPGNYTAIVSAATGNGVALLEVYDVR